MAASQVPSLPAGCVAVILPAAGRSRRFAQDGEKKVFAILGDRPVWQHAVERLRQRPEVGPMVIAIAAEDRPRWESQQATLDALGVTLCEGGSERSDSVRNGLACLGDSPLVAIHDAARPLVPAADVAAVIAMAQQTGAALLATPVRATLKKISADAASCQTLDRQGVWEALTPQVFQTSVLRRAYQRWQGRVATDDAQLVERSGHPVRIVSGSAINIKITHPEDLRIAAALLNT